MEALSGYMRALKDSGKWSLLSTSARLVVIVLADRIGVGASSWVKTADLCGWSGLCDKTVRDALGDLERFALISRMCVPGGEARIRVLPFAPVNATGVVAAGR